MLNQMIRDVRNILTTIMHTFSSVTATSEELAAISEQSSRAIQLLAESGSELAQGSEKQVNAVIDSVAILEQFSAGLEQIEDNCRSMSNLSVISSENCEKGKIVVREALVQMKQIQDSVQDSATIINQLGQHSREIEGIVTFITDIANKTNMLAHNAAIESAHAGAHGRGFAVIAEEVRNLSEESKASTKQMASLLSLIQSESLEAVASMQENTSKIARGLEKTQQASESFDTIQASVENVTGKVQVVNRAVEEMSKASKQLVQAVELVQMIAEKGLHLSQQNSASAEEQLATMQELEASAQALAHLADEMQTLLAIFKL
ncbi:hypothetical protein KDJ56_13920 [Brevibacillus composti]|uniref:Methyl-accepting transducer domain-containing protein n=1 Tax=Brevibacillus composti TaxID=2796470 RepID=A0A7T5EI73_9BACL|nr:methyl-accepting chemotaxis protein [Brevibacillus composti]QQE73038.1 hypothetical protein JD108_13975 [Brevibacillus composti]QUO40116.1 hypothetical protein KDJ56_13920 [Brevibacillus composti]